MSASDLRLHHQELPPEEIEEKILGALRGRQGTVTVNDLVVATGLPGIVLEPVFRSMVLRYDCSIDVGEDGKLRYRFDPELVPNDGGEALRKHRFRKKLWAAFKVLYKVLIVVILVGYVIAFAVLLIAALVAGSKSNDQNKGSSREKSRPTTPHGHTSSYWMMRSMMGTRGARLRPPSRFEALPPVDPRPIWEKVFSFVFGLDTTADDPLVDRKQLLSFLVEKQGVIAPMELSARTGWSPQASERESSRLLAEYDGGVEILSDGQTVFAFDGLQHAVPAGVTPTPPFWERFELKLSNSGNQAGINTGIFFLNLFVLVNALFIAPSWLIPTLFEDGAQSIGFLLLSIIPGVFSVSFFGIPLWRLVKQTHPENRARAQRNARRVVMRDVYERALSGQPQFEEFECIDSAMRRPRPTEAPFPTALQDALRDALRQIAQEWGASQDVNDEGKHVYDFARIAAQYREAADYRARPGSIETHRVRDEFAAFDHALNESLAAEEAMSIDAPNHSF